MHPKTAGLATDNGVKMKIEKKNTSVNRMGRKKFFYSLSIGFLSAFAVKNLLFNVLTSRKTKIKNPKVVKNSRVKINPLAVSRKNIGGGNV